MEKGQYEELCKLTDQILMETGAEPTRVAIPWLHVVRGQPVILKQYARLFQTERRYDLILNFWHSFRKKLSLVKAVLKSIFSSSAYKWEKYFNIHSDSEILFISHLLNESQLSEALDNYFSDLPKILKKSGLKSLVCLQNHTGRKVSLFPNNLDNESTFKVVFPETLNTREEIQNIFLLWKESNILKKLAKAELIPLKKNILMQASTEALSSSSLYVLRLAKQVEYLVRKNNYKAIIVTFEGHSWERLVFSTAKKFNKEIKCIGYIHSPLFKRQHAVRRSLAKDYNPDIIWTSGLVQKKLLDKENAIKDIPKEVLGSNRCSNVPTKSNSIVKSKKVGERYKLLVVPEGIMSEILLLFDYTLHCAMKNPKLSFVWRLHSLFSFDALTAQNEKYNQIPNNIEISENDLNSDIMRCQWVIYRGSSAVFQAVVAGLRPIYLHVLGEMKFDPLYGLNDWKIEIDSTKDIFEIISKLPVEEENYLKALDYCLNYYMPFEKSTLNRIVSQLKDGKNFKY